MSRALPSGRYEMINNLGKVAMLLVSERACVFHVASDSHITPGLR